MHVEDIATFFKKFVAHKDILLIIEVKNIMLIK